MILWVGWWHSRWVLGSCLPGWHQLGHSLGLSSAGTFSPHGASSFRGLVWTVSSHGGNSVQKVRTQAQQRVSKHLRATAGTINTRWPSPEWLGADSTRVWHLGALSHWVSWEWQPAAIHPLALILYTFFYAKHTNAFTRPAPQTGQVEAVGLKSRLSRSISGPDVE